MTSALNTTDPGADYQRKQNTLVTQLKALNKSGSPIAVAKRTSNLFRARKTAVGPKLDFKQLNRVIGIDAETMTAEVEAATIYRDLVDATLAHGLMPAVVPQFITITVGGAVSGGACEASSYKYGAVHETVTEMTVLLSDGSIVTATPQNEHSDLFFALPNTFGSLGYILKLKIKLVPVKPFVKLQHLHFSSADDYFALIDTIMASEQHDGQPVDFLDGIITDEQGYHLTIARFADEAPYHSDYKYMNIYYQSLSARNEDYLTVRDFIWRWDADWAWGSKLFGLQNKIVRLIFGKFTLNSFSYWRLVGLDRRFKLANKLKLFQRTPQEPMVQDVEVPVTQASRYIAFYMKQFDLRPIWVCPLKSDKPMRFPFSNLDPNVHYINFGFWGNVTSEPSLPPHHFNRLLETSAKDYHGHKALYSTNFYPAGEFWQIFDKKHYDTLKTKYDPSHRLKGFYEKVRKEQV